MKIALLSSVGVTLDSFFPEIVSYWEKSGIEVITAASTFSSVGNFTEIRSLSRKPSLRNVFAPSELRQWLNKNSPDVLITNTATASAMARISGTKVPVVYFCHGLHWESSSNVSSLIWQTLEKSLLRKTSGVILINSDDERWFERQKACPPFLRLKFGIGVPASKYPRTIKPSRQMNRVNLIWAGEFSSRKRPHLAIYTLKSLKQLGVDCHLTMLGNGKLHRQTAKLVKKFQLEDNVSMPGHQPLYPALIDSDAFIHTAKWEGLPRVMLEAYSVGRPMFALDAKGVRDIPGVHLSVEATPTSLAAEIYKSINSETIWESTTYNSAIESASVATEIFDYLVAVSSKT